MTSIGLFPDVGGSFFLPRLDGELGTFLGLTGHRLKGEDAFLAGFGTHFVPASRLDSLLASLAELETDDVDTINSCIDNYSGTISAEKFKNWSLGGEIGVLINRVFKFNTIEEILAALETEVTAQNSTSAFAAKQLEILKSVSPISLKVTLEQLRRGAKMDFASCFRMEYNMVKNFLVTPDFGEGVTAKLIEKREPVWKPMDTVSQEQIDAFFKLPKVGQLNLYNRLSFYEYPHKTLSGLPTDRDVRRIVHGEVGGSDDGFLPKSRKDVLDWVEKNWGHYNSEVMTENNLPKESKLFGGKSYGKIGLIEKVSAILDSHTIESEDGLQWKQ